VRTASIVRAISRNGNVNLSTTTFGVVEQNMSEYRGVVHDFFLSHASYFTALFLVTYCEIDTAAVKSADHELIPAGNASLAAMHGSPSGSDIRYYPT
jgi:hypothetical protein